MQWFPGRIEKSRQKWLFVFRLITNIFLTVIIVLIHLNGRTPDILGYWSNVITVVMIMSFGFAIAHFLVWPMIFGPAVQVTIQVIVDIVWASVLIVLTGGCESAINFLMIIAVINSAFLGGLKISFMAATVATAAWALIVDLHYYGYLPGLPPLGEYMTSSELAVNIMVNTGASYMVAILGGYLSSQLELSSQALVTSQSSLERLSELNDNIIHSIDSGLITIDNQERILSINHAAREILRLSSGEVIGRPWRFFFPELDRLEKIPLKFPHVRGPNPGLKFSHVRPVDKVEIMLEMNMLALLDEENDPWGSLMVLKDLTAISQMEAEIKRNEHLAAMGKMAAGLAHEIRNPLASMKGSWHMISGQNLGPDHQRRLMLIIGREMERLDLLVNEFLSFARPTAGSPSNLNLAELVRDQVELLKSWKRDELDISVNGDEALPEIFFDKSQLAQIVWNLLQNAIEAADDSRGIKINIDMNARDSHSGTVNLSVTDYGKGISEEHVKSIFEPFYTTKPNGTGLGLATSWSLLKKGNGDISVRSIPGVQTVFTVTLPVSRAGALGEGA
ncbi:MAG: PAS domain-containing protein [Deltaproteobacteria bacterium]|jgi:two-component system sensor histidine kinase PilS (NtrC family)|nr:PAS domain-containing protein [Deltaproteobacteria bacterium]